IALRIVPHLLSSLLLLPRPLPPLFPYTTLFRSAYASCNGLVKRVRIPGRSADGWILTDGRKRTLGLLPPSSATAPSERHRSSVRSEEHTSELQSRVDLVCRLLLVKKNR